MSQGGSICCCCSFLFWTTPWNTQKLLLERLGGGLLCQILNLAPLYIRHVPQLPYHCSSLQMALAIIFIKTRRKIEVEEQNWVTHFRRSWEGNFPFHKHSMRYTKRTRGYEKSFFYLCIYRVIQSFVVSLLNLKTPVQAKPMVILKCPYINIMLQPIQHSPQIFHF